MRFVSVIVSILLVGTAIFGMYHIVVLFSNINDPSISGGEGTTTESPPSVIVECNENVTSSEPCFGLVMTTRSEWLAQPPHNPIDKLNLPAGRIIITDTKTEECSKKPECNYLVRIMQGNHMSSTTDIKYNFLISTQGNIYEGRGWSLQSAEPAEDLKRDSYWIALIGNFTAIPAGDKQLQAVQQFANRAISAGKLNSTYSIYCSQDILITPDDIDNKFDGNYRQCLNTH